RGFAAREITAKNIDLIEAEVIGEFVGIDDRNLDDRLVEAIAGHLVSVRGELVDEDQPGPSEGAVVSGEVAADIDFDQRVDASAGVPERGRRGVLGRIDAHRAVDGDAKVRLTGTVGSN